MANHGARHGGGNDPAAEEPTGTWVTVSRDVLAQRGEAFRAVAKLLGVVGTCVCLLNLFTGSSGFRHAGASATVAVLATSLSVAARRELLTARVASHLLLSASFIVIAYATRMRTGLTAPTTAWITVFSVIAIVLLGAKESIVWSVAAAVVWIYLGVVEDTGAWDAGRGSIRTYVGVNLLALGAIYGVVVAFQSGLLRALDELEDSRRHESEARREAERLVDARTHLLARMSHEIRTPMNGVLGIAELLHEANLPGSPGEHVATLRQSGRTMVRILDDVLAFSRLEAGEIGFEREAISPRRVIAHVSRLLAPNAQVRGVELATEVDDDVPELVAGDALRLQQVLVNLVSNAIKFTPEGSVRITLSVDETSDGPRLVFAVRDTGMGIPSHRLDAIFDPFRQADDSTARRYGGTGLGLTISRGLVRGMGGELAVESTVGVGSTFRFELPLEAPPERLNASEDAELSARTSDAPARTQRLVGRVLLVDDDATNREIGELMLTHLGVDCVLAPSGAEAITLRFADDFELILMDCQMPEMDGQETTNAIRAREAEEQRARLPIVALSASTLDVEQARCREAGMDGFLAKPLTLDALAGTLGEWLRQE